MLKRIDAQAPAGVRIGEAAYPAPFPSGLEYAPPARGTWNIVHTGMLIPNAHQIFVCAAGCLRGVVLTAAEMGASGRFSTIEIREENVLRGDMEELMIEGTLHILDQLPYTPSAVLVYTSCIHHFLACDLDRVYRVLRERRPDVRFADCYMNPVMRKSGLTPDQLMRRQLYAFLEKRPFDQSGVNMIGNDLPSHKSSDLAFMIRRAGRTLRELPRCKSFEEYMQMSESPLNITTFPAAEESGDALSRRLGQRHLHLPCAFDYETICQALQTLADALDTQNVEGRAELADAALKRAGQTIGGMPVSIDYTAVSRPLELAKLLTEHGFCVREVYLDSVASGDKAAFDWLREKLPTLVLYPSVHPQMRMQKRERTETTLAVGQKAAYFTGTDRFVNMVEDGGLFGFGGIAELAALMEDACLHPKDTRALIQIKGLGCQGGCA